MNKSEDTENKEKEEESQEFEGQEVSEERHMSIEELIAMVAGKEEKEEKDKLEDMRSIGLYGDVEEESISEVISGLLTLQHTGMPKLSKDGEVEEEGKPIKLYISTYGGSADEMASYVCRCTHSSIRDKRRAIYRKELSCNDPLCYCRKPRFSSQPRE